MVEIETLYKTAEPLAEVSECYELSLSSGASPDTANDAFYRLRVDHGWWDEQQKKFIHGIKILEPEKGSTLEEAGRQFRKQKLYYAQQGFIHSFTPSPYGDRGFDYEHIDVELLTQQVSQESPHHER